MASLSPQPGRSGMTSLPGSRRGLEHIVQSLEASGGLSPSWSVATVVDALWALGAPETYQLLVVERGWSQEEYGRYLRHQSEFFLAG